MTEADDLKSFVKALNDFVDVPTKGDTLPTIILAASPVAIGDLLSNGEQERHVVAISGCVLTLDDGSSITLS